MPFTGILELKGKGLNNYFREMETVSHDNWEPGRHKNPIQAKQYYREIKEWIRGIITELAEHTSEDEMDIEGLGGVLQTEPDVVEGGDSDNKSENSMTILEKSTYLSKHHLKSQRASFTGKEVKEAETQKVQQEPLERRVTADYEFSKEKGRGKKGMHTEA